MTWTSSDMEMQITYVLLKLTVYWSEVKIMNTINNLTRPDAKHDYAKKVNGQQFHQYQQSEQSGLPFREWLLSKVYNIRILCC